MNTTLPRITVSENHRFLITETGEPFFWLADTDWEIFHRLTLEEAEFFLKNRQSKGFNVIQAVALAEFDGLHTPNAYGEYALLEDDPTRPNEAYFRHVDAVIRMAADHGIYVALLPTWGDKVAHMWGVGPIVFNEENACIYGRWLGERYRGDTNIIWVLGGDRPAFTDTHDYRPIWRAMAAGIDEGVGRRVIKTYHPSGRQSSSQWLHEEEWLDFNMMQSGHGSGRSTPTWEMITHDYHLEADQACAGRRTELRGPSHLSVAHLEPRKRLLPRRRCTPPMLSLGLCRRLRRDLWAPHDVAV